MKKTILSLVLISSIIGLTDSVVAATSDLPGENAVLECYNASIKTPPEVSKMGNINNPINPKRSLICQGKTPEDVLYQAVLDILFTQIDIKVEKYLLTFKGTSQPVKAVDDLQKKMGISGEEGSFSRIYSSACTSGIWDYMGKFAKKNNIILTINNQNFNIQCEKLGKSKLMAFYNAGEVIIGREVMQSYEKAKKEYMTNIKEKYRNLLFKFTIYLGQLKVIDAKWYTATENPSN